VLTYLELWGSERVLTCVILVRWVISDSLRGHDGTTHLVILGESLSSRQIPLIRKLVILLLRHRVNGYGRDRELHIVKAFDDQRLGRWVEPKRGDVSWCVFVVRLGWVLFDIFKDS
jgi:hypothetical protein